ncbi:MAG: ABC transporter permease [Ilumatobacter sp.]|uniref:ABC transporter permease n=1 Tax=Ilumatobacter sp. TaxID=1967498 RepID=UPI00329775FE
MLWSRLLGVIPLLFIVTVIVFGLIFLVPGDPAVTLAGENATEERIDEVRSNLGLDDPVVVQYGRWVGDAVQGDFGTSLFSSAKVTDLVGGRFTTTIVLTAGALVFALAVGVPAGVLAASKRGSWVDRLVTLGATTGVALPSYFLAMLLILFLAIRNSWLPATGYVPFGDDPAEWAKSLVLPSIALGSSGAAVTARQLRSSLIDVFAQDYVRTARAKGMRSHTVVLKHALKNAAIPVVTVLGLQISFLLGGTVVIEQIFGIPGLGQLAITAVTEGDLPLIQGIVVVATLVVIGVNLIVDLMYGYLNPKVRAR